AEFDQAHAPLLAARDRFEKEELPGRLQKWLADQKQKPTPAWLVLDPLTTPVKINVKDGKKATSTNTYTLTARTLHRGITRLRLEVPHEEGDAAKAEMKAQLTVTASPLADKARKQKPTPVRLKADQVSLPSGKEARAVFEIDGEVGFEGGTLLTITLKLDNDRLKNLLPRIALSTAKAPVAVDAPAEPQSAQELLLALNAHQVTAANREEVVHWFRKLDPAANQVYEKIEQHNYREPLP